MGQIYARVDELIKERELREGRRLQIADVAHATGIPSETLVALIHNRASHISFEDLAKLCAYFQCTAGELFHYDADPLVLDQDEVESRDIVARWESIFGADEYPPDQ